MTGRTVTMLLDQKMVPRELRHRAAKNLDW
jgi:hypothetical protein